MPANPVSPLRAVNVERYEPTGGSNLVGEVGDDVVEEHAPMIKVQTTRGAVKRIDPSRPAAVAHTTLLVIYVCLCL
jgi:hypothetical protein